jgi:hypothetical protein
VFAGQTHREIGKPETPAIDMIFVPFPYLVFKYQSPFWAVANQPSMKHSIKSIFLILSDPELFAKEQYSKDRYLPTSENNDDRFDKIDICRAYRAMDLPFNKSAGFRLTLYEHLAVILEHATFTSRHQRFPNFLLRLSDVHFFLQVTTTTNKTEH